ncbi:uncharacterized protein LOC135340249 isoform X2 [Halichondria panicea]|uniref:uncharacterized protein LOC135340249 isoform X2 n=1 Tax=Halichondria panicea TaxID=6063 RepID=UPI00312B4505
MRIQLCVQIILKRLRLNSKVMTKISSKLPTLNAESELMVETDEARDKAPSPNCPLLMRDERSEGQGSPSHLNGSELIVPDGQSKGQSSPKPNDCALFAAAYCTSIAHGLDPCSLVYDQQQVRDHLYKCFTTKTMDLFTVFRTKRPGPARTLKIPVYCYCRCADDGQGMVGCDGCEDW